MGAGSKGWVEKLRRIARTIYFMIAMVASLLVMSLPLLVAIGDVLLPALLISSFTCVTCHSIHHHLRRYAFNSSLTDIPLVSVIRSLLITCMSSPLFPFAFFVFDAALYCFVHNVA